MIKELRRRMGTQSEESEVLNEELENTKSRGEEYNNRNEKYARRGRLQTKFLEEGLSELEDRAVEITAAEEKKRKRMKRNEDNLRDFGATSCILTFTL